MKLWNNYEIKNCYGDNLEENLHRLFINNSFAVANNNEFYTNFCSDESVKINQWFCTLEEGEAGFTHLPALHKKEGLIFPTEERLTEEAKSNWCFIDNPGKGKRSRNRLERLCSYQKPQLLYAAAQIFSKEEEERILFINNGHNPLPMKVWLNDRLIFSSYRENLYRRSECIIKLHAGSNIFLVEREIIPRHKIKDMFMDTNFTISIYSMSYLLQYERGTSFLENELFVRVSGQIDFITPKRIYQESENIPYYLISHNNFQKQNYEILVLDMGGTEIYKNTLDLLQTAEIILSPGVRGILKIVVLKAGKAVTTDYILVGSINQLLSDACNTKGAEELINILDFDKDVVRDSIYPCDCNVFFHVFQNFYYMVNAENTQQYYQLRMVGTHEQGKKRSIGVLLPDDYSRDKEYPLILQYIACYGNYAIPGLNGGYPDRCIRNKNFKNVIIAVIPCDYEKFHIYELMSVGKIYNFLITEYSVDKRRVSLMGFCGSSNSCIKLLSHYSHVFSAVALLAPFLDEKALEQTIQQEEELQLHMVLNPNTSLFLPGIHYTEYYETGITITSGIEHEELYALYNNENLVSFLTQYEKKKTVFRIDTSEQINHMGIASMYTHKCNIYVDCPGEEEIPIMQELLISMKLSKSKNSNIRVTGKHWKLCEDDYSFLIYGSRHISKGLGKNVQNEIGCVVTTDGILFRDHLFKGDTFLVAISVNRRRCYIIYTSLTALKELKNLWENVLECPLFFYEYILWNEGEIFKG